MKIALPVIAILALSLSPPAFAKADKEAGKRVFAQCAACHRIDASGSHGVGPNLNKVIGRRAGTVPGFRFSPAMVASNRVWSESALDAYLAAPMTSMPGSRMPFAGLRNAADRRNVIAYIKSAAK